MPKRPNFAERMQAEKLPVANGQQYRAEAVKVIDDKCTGCAAAQGGVINKDLCNALPPCGKSNRTDGLNVRYVACGPAKAAPQVKTVTNGRGGVRFEHDAFKVGTRCLHAGTGEEVEVVGDGMAGMPEVKFADGHTIFAFPQDLKPVLKGGAS